MTDQALSRQKFTETTAFSCLLAVGILMGLGLLLHVAAKEGRNVRADATLVSESRVSASLSASFPAGIPVLTPDQPQFAGTYLAPGGRVQEYSVGLEEGVIGAAFMPGLPRSSEEMIAAVNQVSLHAGQSLQALCMPELKRVEGINYVVFTCPDGSGVRVLLLQDEGRQLFVGMGLEAFPTQGLLAGVEP